MKILNIIMAICVMFALTGCFCEDFTDCPDPNNVTINFALPSDGGYDSFTENVFAATTAIYDQDGELVTTVETNNEHHLSFKGIRMNLPPGEYRVISWGNTDFTENTRTIPMNIEYHYKPEAEALVTYSDIKDGVVGNADDLYYGPNTVNMLTRQGEGSGNEVGEYILTVTDKGHFGTINFRHSHRRIEVYVKNFDDGAGGSTPLVQLTDLPQGLTFGGMKPAESLERVKAEIPTEMVAVRADEAAGEYAMAPVSSFYFKLNDHEIDVNVVHPLTKEIVYTAHLHDYIEPSDIDAENNVVLKLLIEFLGDTEVKVSIPTWDIKDVEHGIFG